MKHDDASSWSLPPRHGRGSIARRPVLATLALLLAVTAGVGPAEDRGSAPAVPGSGTSPVPTTAPALRDVFSDTWVATDGLGRRLPTHEDVGPPRADRTVGIFYFLWHGAHIAGGPYDVTRILAKDPAAMEKKDSPLWGPLHAPHHWGESIFGYYLTDDEGVLRKHALQLSDLGIDAVIFDVTNQITYPEWYRALLRVWSELRAAGNRTPQVAFLCPFWDPQKVVHELWRDLYEPGLHRDLWFLWDGKPLILADPVMIFDAQEQAAQDVPVEIAQGHTLGQTFTSSRSLRSVAGRFPTWGVKGSAVTLTLRREGPGGEVVTSRRFERVEDNAWLDLELPGPQPAGTYYLEASEPEGRIGWWSHSGDKLAGGKAMADGKASGGDRTLRILFADGPASRIRESFTFRKPQPDYFRGPTGPDMWSWLEVFPQHVFRNSRGEKEQMSVGVAQNAVGSRLGSMSEPGAKGRSFHGGATDARPGAIRLGLNLEEQWEHALREDPRFVFVTGWNEWIAGRFDEFNGVRRPVMFVDQFDQEHSRDIEPMRGGHGDDYYYQLAAYVRRYKGARPIPAVRPRPIEMDGRFEDWADVEPEFRDSTGDPTRRSHRGWDPHVKYEDATGRNDIVLAKVSFDASRIWFHARTREPLSPPDGAGWMMLFIDADRSAETGWLGFDLVVNRQPPRRADAIIERALGRDYRWGDARPVPLRIGERELELEIPLDALGTGGLPHALDFKWADRCIALGDWTDFTLHGDAAPDSRFAYRAILEVPAR